MAQTRMRPKIPDLRLALEGGFDDHHALMLRMHLRPRRPARPPRSTGSTRQVDAVIAPFAEQRPAADHDPRGRQTHRRGHDRRDRRRHGPVPDRRTPRLVGRDVPGQPRIGRQDTAPGRPARATPHCGALCEAAWAAARTKDTYSRRSSGGSAAASARSEAKAIFAVAHAMLVIMLAHPRQPDADYHELGDDWFDRRNDTAAQTRRLVAQLERLGHTVTLQPAA